MLQEQRQIPDSVRRQQEGQQTDLGERNLGMHWGSPIDMVITLAMEQVPHGQLLRHDVRAGLCALCADPKFGAEDLTVWDVGAVRHILDAMLTDARTRSEAFNLSILALKLATERDPMAIPAFTESDWDVDARDAAWAAVGVVSLALQAARDPNKIVLSTTIPKKPPAKPKKNLRGLLARGLRKATRKRH